MHELPLAGKDRQNATGLQKAYAFTRSATFHQGLIVAIGTLICLIIFIITVTPKRYNLTTGLVPTHTISANKDVEDEVTTLRNRDQAAANVTPIYHYQEGITEKVMLSLDAVYAQMLAVRQFAQSLPDYNANRVYSPEEFEAAHEIMNLVDFQNFQLATLMNATAEQFDEMYTSLNPAIRNTMQGNITQGQESIAITAIMQVVGFKTNVSLLQNVVLPLLRAIILPNMVVDEDATEAARHAAWQAVEPVIFKQGQNIVVAGEGRIRDNQIAMLNSLGLLSDHSIDYSMYLGAIALVMAMLVLMGLFLRHFNASVYQDNKRLMIVYLVTGTTMLLSLLAKSIDLMYLAPLVLPYMLLSVTLGVLPGIIVGITTTLISVMMMTSMSMRVSLNKGLWAMAGTVISALLCLSLQPAYETLFNLPTPMRLLDLTNPNHPLMRRLLMEAPGTYHHSIIIANLAETAAEAIGANPLLARAGAYFHDIGKLKRPSYFKENQIGTSNVHDTTDPHVSAAIIISHVREGIAMAKQNRLPYEIQQIIAEHHGDSLVQYFYHKAVKEANGKPVDEADFRYPGVPPQTMEGAVIMVCDTVEAAIRTLSNPTTDEIVSFIDELIQKKVQSGMMVNAPLTLQQLNQIRDSCASVIYGVFHERIEYPKSADKLLPGERLIAHLQQLRSSKPKAEVALPKPANKPYSTEIDVVSPPAFYAPTEEKGSEKNKHD